MRHWFDSLLAQTRCMNLVYFDKFLASRGVTSRDRVVSHDLLKKWASTQELMPHHAVCAVLDGCKPEVDANKEQLRLWFARLLTFLCELIGSFSAEPVEEKAARKAVHQRLSQLGAEFQAA